MTEDYVFESFEEFRDNFCSASVISYLSHHSGDVNIVIGGKSYSFIAEQPLTSILSLTQPNSKHILVYESVDKEQLLLAWGFDNQCRICPLDTKLYSIQLEQRDPEIEAHRKQEEEARKIGVTIDVQINGINGGESIRAKVDTGATTCSLDAQDIQVSDDAYNNGQLVTFTFRDRQYRTAVLNHQSVRTADAGVQNRPTVKFSVSMNGQSFPEIEFNLNDRSGMEYDVLIGMNFLSKTKFLIDPKKESANINWESLHKLFEDASVRIVESQSTSSPPTPEQLQEIISAMYKYPNVTLTHIAQQMKLETLSVVESLQ